MKGKGVVRGKMGGECKLWNWRQTLFERNSLQGSEFRRRSVALWLAEERWNENHSKLLTPVQELCRNAQPQLWHGGTEPALFLCLLHQSNRDGGERKRGEGAQGGRRETQKQEGGREERKSSERLCGLKMNICFFTQGSTVEALTQAHTVFWKANPSTVFSTNSTSFKI